MYTPRFDGALNVGIVSGKIKLSDDNLIINNGNPLPQCSDISIDVRITEEVDEMLNGVIAVKGLRVDDVDDSCSCIPLPPVRYYVNKTVFETTSSNSGKVHLTSSLILYLFFFFNIIIALVTDLTSTTMAYSQPFNGTINLESMPL